MLFVSMLFVSVYCVRVLLHRDHADSSRVNPMASYAPLDIPSAGFVRQHSAAHHGNNRYPQGSVHCATTSRISVRFLGCWFSYPVLPPGCAPSRDIVVDNVSKSHWPTTNPSFSISTVLCSRTQRLAPGHGQCLAGTGLHGMAASYTICRDTKLRVQRFA